MALIAVAPSAAGSRNAVSAAVVEIQYLAPLSSCYSFTVAQVTVK
jgi:hypothetical protein